MNNHKDLDVWKKAVDFVVAVYQVTSNFPKDELYGLTNQIRRASVSIPSNIAEGAARKGKVEFKRFLYFSLGSISEIETQFIISLRLQYLTQKDFEIFINELTSIRKMLLGLIKSLN
jgi:four helix bundle protein